VNQVDPTSPGVRPTWAVNPTFDAATDWMPIVCSGGPGALAHEPETIGLFFGPTPQGWQWMPRPVLNDRGEYVGRSYISLSRVGVETEHYLPESDELVTVQWDDGGGQRREIRRPATEDERNGFPLSDGSMFRARRSAGPGSIVISCPACTREHRIAREAWGRFLERCRDAPGITRILVNSLP
jgi:hypothetical protein